MFESNEHPVNGDYGGLSADQRWFVAFTASHHEKHVVEHLTRRQVETFLPLYTESRQWSKRAPVEVNLPLFPNYVFVRIAHGQRTTVLSTPGVFSIVGNSKKSWDLPDRHIEALRTALHERKIRPHPYLTVGEKAQVRSGVFAGVEGVVIREKANLRMVVSLDLIMRSITVEVSADELEPVLPTGAPLLLHRPKACA